MLRALRIYALGCVAISFAYLALHAHEPLRLDLGDPWGDANVITSVTYVQQYGFHDRGDTDPLASDRYRPIHYPPLPEAIYCAVGSLGISDVGAFRFLALTFSALALWLFFLYTRRVWSEAIALIASALVATSLMWMMFADSIRHIPVVHASGFLALWGLVRAIDTGRRRYYTAALIGSFLCFLSSYDFWLVLPAAVPITVYVMRGSVFARGSLRFIAICALGCIAALAIKGLFTTGVIGWQVYRDRMIVSSIATLVRRYTLLFTPMLWPVVAITTWRAVRAPTFRSLIDDKVMWLLAVATTVLVVFSQRAASPMLGAEPLLLFYAIGSAALIAKLLEGGALRRMFAIGWLAIAPIWAFYVLLQHPRAVLDRSEVAEVNAYLAANDRNDFVMSNLLSDGPIQAAFDRHTWAAPDDPDAVVDAHLDFLDVFEATGTDYFHAVIFTDPSSRFIDRSLGALTINRRLAAVTGWPFFNRSKANEIIRDYDKRVLKHIEAVHAKHVLHLAELDVYRIDRASVLEAASAAVPIATKIDFGSPAATRHMLLGWGKTLLNKEGVGVTSIEGFAPCANPVTEHRAGEPTSNACETTTTRKGVRAVDEGRADRAQLLVRVERPCDLEIHMRFAEPALIGASVNDFVTSQCDASKDMSFVVPQRSTRAGVNVITFDKKYRPKDPKVNVEWLTIEPRCNP